MRSTNSHCLRKASPRVGRIATILKLSEYGEQRHEYVNACLCEETPLIILF